MRLRTGLAIATLLLVSACSEPEPVAAIATEETPPPVASTAAVITATATLDPEFISRGKDAFVHLAAACQQLQLHTEQFLQTKTTEDWQLLRDSWLTTHQLWHRGELFLSIADYHPKLFAALAATADNIHTTPVLPGYVDAVAGYPNSGLINDITVAINLATLRQQHLRFDRGEAALGLHVMEFMLWGEDGLRTAELFQADEQHANNSAQQPAARRRHYLSIVAQALVVDTKQLAKLWPSTATIGRKLPAVSLERLISNSILHQLQPLISNPEYSDHSHFSNDQQWRVATLESTHYWLEHHHWQVLDEPRRKQLDQHFQTTVELLQNANPDQALELRQQLARLIGSMTLFKTPVTSE